MITNEPTFDRSRPARLPRRVSRRAAVSSGAAGMTLLTMLGAPGLSAARQESTPSSSQPTLSLPLYPYGQPLFLDPHRATNWGPHWILLPHVWAGLLRFDENGAATTDLASAIEPEQDGQIWVAEIRSEVTYASGNPVTAPSLIEGWKRALDPQHLAPMAGYMSRVEGYNAYIAGESQEIGFEARSETTIAIHLSEPYALFPEDLATFVWAAVDVVALEDVRGSDVPFADASAGLWTFAPSEDGTLTRMIPSPNPTGDLPGTFAEVQWRSVSGAQAAETALNLYQNQDLAIADITGTLRDFVQQDDSLAEQVHTVPLSGSTMLIGMDFNQAPFDDLRVRQAVAASIDRATWASGIQAGAFAEATSITPPVLAETANYVAPEPLAFDPDRAKSLLAEAGLAQDSQPPVIYYLRADASQSERDQAAALLDMIKSNSGLVIELDSTLTTEQIEALRTDNDGLQFDLRWWWPLSNSPSGLNSLAAPSSGNMTGWFNWSPDLENEDAAASAEAFVSLTSEAAKMMEKTERVQAYAEAEKILIDNAVYIPLGHGVQTYVQSTTLTGTRQGAFTGYAPVVLNGDVVLETDTGTPTA